MNKKKIGALLVAATLAIGAIGGSLAWFTSQHSVTNAFSTGTTDDPTNTDSGIEVEEEFDEDDAKNITPGTEVTKEVKVNNTASYDQFIRAKVDITFYDVDEDGEKTEITNSTKIASLKANLQLNYFTENINGTTEFATEKWKLDEATGYYYYLDKLAADESTKELLKSVKLLGTATNEFKNIAFDVDVLAESIQASNGAYKDWSPEALKSTYQDLEADN